MNQSQRILSVILFCSVLSVRSAERPDQATQPTYSSRISHVTTQLCNAWQNRWVKVGTITTSCVALYAIAIKLNLLPAPSLAFFAATTAITTTASSTTANQATTIATATQKPAEAQNKPQPETASNKKPYVAPVDILGQRKKELKTFFQDILYNAINSDTQ